MSGEEGFFSRWSQRKQLAREDPAPKETPRPSPLPSGERAESAPQPPPPPPPTLADVAQLTRDADFSRFVAADVDNGVKQAALKKLFSDPHFNVMDGLDTYIDDYNKPDPLPASMLRKMAQAQFLGLFRDEDKAQEPAAVPSPEADADENADLRLQPDDAAGRPGADEGAAGEPGDRAA